MGILTDAEYATEKETIMNLLKELKSHWFFRFKDIMYCQDEYLVVMEIMDDIL